MELGPEPDNPCDVGSNWEMTGSADVLMDGDRNTCMLPLDAGKTSLRMRSKLRIPSTKHAKARALLEKQNAKPIICSAPNSNRNNRNDSS